MLINTYTLKNFSCLWLITDDEYAYEIVLLKIVNLIILVLGAPNIPSATGNKNTPGATGTAMATPIASSSSALSEPLLITIIALLVALLIGIVCLIMLICWKRNKKNANPEVVPAAPPNSSPYMQHPQHHANPEVVPAVPPNLSPYMQHPQNPQHPQQLYYHQ
ncbi:14405_t:CDS:2 [Acaulospora morrowiae]|uniref:14405_t:CDS:1 n=1 Tax=Acaulospora morrowiae TaxID=94023 RepID=A0A9N9FJN2_9GLOM|nr:14405_t:CDS:2 [Acaulospora morrowiae]